MRAENLIVEWRQDGSFVRFALAAVLPLLFCVSLVRALLLLSSSALHPAAISTLTLHAAVFLHPDRAERDNGVSVSRLLTRSLARPPARDARSAREDAEIAPRRIGPIAQYHRNSKFYSARKPRPNARVDDALPHITIQMPVYKEGLEGVLCVSP